MNIDNMPKVIDVSRWQGHINWPIVKTNVKAAIIKIGGSDVGFYMDGYAHRNLIEARSAGVPIGVYFYLGGVHTVSEEVQHIIATVTQLGGLHAGEPLVLDWEARRAGHDEVAYLTGIARELIERGFPPPMIYMNLHYVVSQNWQSLVALKCPLWVAAWGDNDARPERHEVPGSQEWKEWALWQFSSTGSIPGIAGRVDLNLLNGSIKDFQAFGHKRGVKFNGSPKPITQPMPAEGHYSVYTVGAGDTLSGIAKRYGRSWQELYAFNRDRISNPDRIFVGQKIRVWAGVQPAPRRQEPKQPEKKPSGARYHVVQNGENLSVIAAKYGLGSWDRLYVANRTVIGGDPNHIVPGTRLRIP